MRRTLPGIGLAIILLASLTRPTGATSVTKCVDTHGQVTYTQQQCPDSTRQSETIPADNPTISAPGEHTRMASPVTAGPGASTTPPVIVVGGTGGSPGCETGLSEQALRTAKVRGEIVPGMSRADIESLYGRPIGGVNARGAGVNTYWYNRRTRISIRFDQNGCVTGTEQSGMTLRPQ